MASACSRIISRSSLSSIRSSIRSNGLKSPVASTSKSLPSPFSLPSKPYSSSSPLRSSFSRIPSELGCVQSLLPLHSAVAAARMTSCLSTTSRSCRALSQGTLCCTSPDL